MHNLSLGEGNNLRSLYTFEPLLLCSEEDMGGKESLNTKRDYGSHYEQVSGLVFVGRSIWSTHLLLKESHDDIEGPK